MDKKKVWQIVCLSVFVLQLVAELMAILAIVRLDMLPGKYVALLVGVMVLFLVLTGLLLFLPIKKWPGILCKVIACIIAFALIIGCTIAIKYALNTHETIENMSGWENNGELCVYVLVMDDDPAQTIADAKDYSFGMLMGLERKKMQKAVETIEGTTGKIIAIKDYEEEAVMAQDLYDGNVDALIISSITVDMLLHDEYDDFMEKTRILSTMPYSQLTEPTEPQATEPKETEPPFVGNVTNTPFVLYISGSDTRSSKLTVSRSDVNILVVVNPVTKQILMINTPRDYYVANPQGEGAMDKLTHCGLYGPECSMEVLEELYDLNINFYGQINFVGFEALVDAVGGVTIYSDHSFKANDTYIEYGENHLNGAQALDYSRERYRVSGGDNGRGKNQMKLVEAVIKKLTSGTTIITRYPTILQSLEGTFSTSMTMEDISMLVKMQLDDMASWNIKSFAVTGVGDSAKTYSAPGSYAYVMREDENATAFAADLAARVIAGETLTNDDMKMPK